MRKYGPVLKDKERGLTSSFLILKVLRRTEETISGIIYAVILHTIFPMYYNDIIGTLGVGLILLAYFLNTARMLEKNRKAFYVMNIVGAALACYASFLIAYMPFVILEGTWTVVSVYGLMKTMRIKMT